MTEILQGFILALVQGITEFLPISSSAHLILASQVFGYSDQGIVFDVVLHLGTFCAVVIYFREDLRKIAQGFLSNLRWQKKKIPSHRPQGEALFSVHLGWMIILGTIPAGLIAVVSHQFITNHLRSNVVIAITTIFFGMVLYIALRYFEKKKASSLKNLSDITWQMALLIGISQAFALIPGVSRSGSTITAALFLGLDKKSGLRFSYYLAIPIVGLASVFALIKLFLAVDVNLEIFLVHHLSSLLIAMFAGLLTIHFLLKWVERIGYLPFVIYRLFFGTFILFYPFFT